MIDSYRMKLAKRIKKLGIFQPDYTNVQAKTA